MAKNILVIVGLPLVGKTTIATILAKKLGFVYLGVEIARKNIEKNKFSRYKRKSEKWEKYIMFKAYVHNHHRAVAYLQKGKSVILDATYSRSVYHKMLFNLKKDTGANLMIIHIDADPKVIKKRLEERSEKDLSNIRSLQDYESVRERYILIESKSLQKIDTTNLTIEESVGLAYEMVHKHS